MTNLAEPTDPHAHHFRTDHLNRDLSDRTVRGGAVTMTAQGLRFALNLGSTALLARLLTPDDFGLVAMVAAITGFLATFRDMGLSIATVQRAEISHGQVSALFWLNVIISLIVTVVTAALAVPIAWFYGREQLVWITAAISLTAVITGLGSEHQALLTRQMRFTALAVIDIASIAVGIIVAAVMAWRGWGYWALVGMQIASAIGHTAGNWIGCSWRPGLWRRGTSVGELFRFGGHLSGFNALNYIVRNLDNVLVGKFWGETQLGFYSRAYQLLLLPLSQINGPISNVAVPALSRLQNDPDRYREYHRKMVMLVCALSMPVVAFLFVSADLAIRLLLGEKWIQAVLIFQLLAPAAFIGTFNVATGWVFVSLGQTDRQFRMGLVVAILTVIAFFCGIPWGAKGVAAAFSTSVCVLRLPTVIYCFKATPLKLADLGRAIWMPAITSVLAGAGLLALRWTVTPLTAHPAIGFAIVAVIYTMFYAAGWWIVPGGRELVNECVAIVKRVMPRRAVAAGDASATPLVVP